MQSYQIKAWSWCLVVAALVVASRCGLADSDDSDEDTTEEMTREVRNDPAEDGPLTSPCPSSCFCEDEVGYAHCVGDGQYAPPTLPRSLTRVQLRGFLVPELGTAQLHNLLGLRELQINQCNVSTVLDDSFAGLDDLDRLDLSENKVGSLGPDALRGLRSLRHLDISANKLRNLTHPFIHLPTLQHLNLRENWLTELTQDTFQGLDQVQYVNLDSNNISTVEVSAFQHLTSLAHLILSNNPLADLATLDFFGSRLQYIDVSNIGISRVPQALTQFVRDLRLAKNHITEIHRGDLDSYPYLGLLVLDDNELQVLEEDALGRHEYLARLWLNGNRLSSLPLSLPPSLRALYIEENLITGLGEGDLANLSNLEQLLLQRNHIASIAPCALCDLTSLKTLDLQANRLTNLTGRVFSRLSSLETLDLSQNPLLTLDADVFVGLTSVRVLQMSRVHSTSVEIPETLFDPLKALQILEMYGSPKLVSRLVSATRLLHSLRSLRELNLMHNDLTNLRTDFPAFFPKLQVAKLSGNMWNCSDPTNVLWLKRWMTRSPVHFYRSYSIRCASPSSLGYKPVMLLEDTDFTTTTEVTISTTPLSSFSSPVPALIANSLLSDKPASVSNSGSTSGPAGAEPTIVVRQVKTSYQVTSPGADTPQEPPSKTSSQALNAQGNATPHPSSQDNAIVPDTNDHTEGNEVEDNSNDHTEENEVEDSSLYNDTNILQTQENSTVTEETTALRTPLVAYVTAKENIMTNESDETTTSSYLENWWHDLVAPDRPSKPRKGSHPSLSAIPSAITPETTGTEANNKYQPAISTLSSALMPDTKGTEVKHKGAESVVTKPISLQTINDFAPSTVELTTVSTMAPTTVTTFRSTIKVTYSKKTTALPYWLIHNKMPEVMDNMKMAGDTRSVGEISTEVSNHLPPFLLRSRHDLDQRRPSQPEAHKVHPEGSERGHHRTSWGLNKDLWVRGDTHGIAGLPHSHSAGATDGAVVGAGVVATFVGVALLVGGLLLARGRGKNGQMWGPSLTYWKEDDEDDVVVSVEECVSGVEVTESEGTLGVVTDTHRGLNNRLYLLMQRDSCTGITPDSLPDLSESH